jgi:hypothetical protein
MRRVLPACLPFLLAACDCGGYPASADRARPPDDPPRELTCAGLTAPSPVEIHELAAGGYIRAEFTRCGHLLADVEGSARLAAPDLAALAPLPEPPGWNLGRSRLAPTGESLLLMGDEGSLLVDLATGGETALGYARELGFFPSHDLDRSILARCTDAGVVAIDRGVERTVSPSCGWFPDRLDATLAPVIAVLDAADGLRIVDLERGTILYTGLPVVVSDSPEPSPSGSLGYRADAAFVSPDGSRVFHIKRWWVLEGDVVEYQGTDEITLVETATGATAVFPGDADGPLGFFRSGFVWGFGWDRTLYAGAAGDGRLGLPCREALPYHTTGQRLLLDCYHEDSPERWNDHVLDTNNLATRDLGAPWTVREVSRNVRAIAGCPRDRWRSGSCTEPVVRRWVAGDDVRDLPLDRTADVVWVGDDGAVLAIATEEDEALLLDPSGAVKTRFPLLPDGDDLRGLEEAGGVLLVKAKSLELVVPATGFHRRLADAWLQAALDPSGERVAFTVPDGDRVRLLAGAVPTASP